MGAFSVIVQLTTSLINRFAALGEGGARPPEVGHGLGAVAGAGRRPPLQADILSTRGHRPHSPHQGGI